MTIIEIVGLTAHPRTLSRRLLFRLDELLDSDPAYG